MPFIYQVSFDLPAEQRHLIDHVGADIDRVVAYLNSLLPDFPGFLTARAMYSMHLADSTRVVYQSVWERWDDVLAHQRSAIEEKKVFSYWGHLNPDQIRVEIYEEVGTG